jgi:hypothetical protein
MTYSAEDYNGQAWYGDDISPRKRRNVTEWTTKNGDVILITDMTKEHLVNTYKMLLTNRPDHYLLEHLRNEIFNRMLEEVLVEQKSNITGL